MCEVFFFLVLLGKKNHNPFDKFNLYCKISKVQVITQICKSNGYYLFPFFCFFPTFASCTLNYRYSWLLMTKGFMKTIKTFLNYLLWCVISVSISIRFISYPFKENCILFISKIGLFHFYFLLTSYPGQLWQMHNAYTPQKKKPPCPALSGVMDVPLYIFFLHPQLLTN